MPITKILSGMWMNCCYRISQSKDSRMPCFSILTTILAFIVLRMKHIVVSAQPGFLSLDCGGNKSYIDNLGIQWEPDDTYISVGNKASISINKSIQLQHLRSFSDQKSCYRIPVNTSQRYLIRATFLYGNYDGKNNLPAFDMYINATLWANIQLDHALAEHFEEMVLLSTGSLLDICLVKGNIDMPFISSLEMRMLPGVMYRTPYEIAAHLKYAVRINFGALSSDDIRYPDDNVDRIWKPDLGKPYHLANEADGTKRYSTNKTIKTSNVQDRPPMKVMQTAVVGTKGYITYRYNLDGFPATSYANAYFAEIQHLNTSDVRKFVLVLNNDTTFQNIAFNIKKDYGAFIALERGFNNITLPQLASFAFQKTSDANLGPILNAMEILQIVEKQPQTAHDDTNVLLTFKDQFGLDGVSDPCIPFPWEWVECSSNLSSEPRVIGILLSDKNLNGTIPATVSQLTTLVDLLLDGNNLTGVIPDLSTLSNLQMLHLQNNKLTGSVPVVLSQLVFLKQLFIQNNRLTGSVPQQLVQKRGLEFLWYGNPGLCSACSRTKTKTIIVVAIIIGSLLLCLVGGFSLRYFYRRKHEAEETKTKFTDTSRLLTISHHQFESPSVSQEQTADQARVFQIEELKEATCGFGQKIGFGGFGIVYYGKLEADKEIAVKVSSNESSQDSTEFFNEVTLLSRIHHKNLVSFIGFCQDGKERMLVYEFMQNGTLHDHLYGALRNKTLSWVIRLRITLDAAKGLEYLHSGCSPSIIHRDVKTSNILISGNWTAKVADFGFSKMVTDGSSEVSVKGTFGYLDPGYFMDQRLTQKSDVYSFGIVLLETISARDPHCQELFLPDSSIVTWARSYLQKGDIKSIFDPALENNFSIESSWKVAELAMFCVEPSSSFRPTMTEVVRELQEAYDLEAKHSDLESYSLIKSMSIESS